VYAAKPPLILFAERKTMKLLIKNGTVINSDETFTADVAVTDGIITAIGVDLPQDNAEIADASGKFVLPGAIDAHTHLAMPFGGTISADDYFAGTRAAACGGTTTVFDFALQDFGERLDETVRRRDKICSKDAAVDYAFHVGIKDIKDGLIDSMKSAADMGVPSFKVFMVYDFGVDDGVFYHILEKAKEINVLISVHAENNDIINYLVQKYAAEGNTSAWYHYMSRPEFVEAEADNRAISWAKALNVPLYIVHLANADGVRAVTKARREGYRIYAETCPQYLEFTNEVYKRADGRNFVCSPPIKGEESRKALWDAVKRGDIAVIATDHCPFKQAEKDRGKDDFTKIPNGCAGIENMYTYMLSRANNGEISFNKAVELCSANPAKIFGCDTKGTIAPGKDADIVLYNPELDFTITADKMHSDTDHTIWEGVKLHGYITQTYSRGKLVFNNGEFTGERGYGKFIKRKLSL
jgi:dihydropyrimidinase